MGNDPESGPVRVRVLLSDAGMIPGEVSEGATNRCLEGRGRRPLHVASQPAPMSDLQKWD